MLAILACCGQHQLPEDRLSQVALHRPYSFVDLADQWSLWGKEALLVRAAVTEVLLGVFLILVFTTLFTKYIYTYKDIHPTNN